MTRKIVNEEGVLKALPLTAWKFKKLRAEGKIPIVKLGHKTFLYDLASVTEALRKLEISK
jgi:hypothetical protein